MSSSKKKNAEAERRLNRRPQPRQRQREGLRAMDQAQLEGLRRNDVASQVISPLQYVLNAEGQVDRKRKSTTFGMHRTGAAWAFFTLKYMYLGAATAAAVMNTWASTL